MPLVLPKMNVQEPSEASSTVESKKTTLLVDDLGNLVPTNANQLKYTKAGMEQFRSTLKSRIAVEQVLETVHNLALFSFDYAALLCIAAIVACIGLVTDQVLIIAAAMLISPLMGPILGMTFGFTVKDEHLLKTSLFTESVGLALCVFIGFVGGLFAAPASMRREPWPTSEMASRGDPRALYVGVAIAFPSGMGVALSILGENTSSLVGVAISASLLPPAVNTGVYWAAACLVDHYRSTDCVGDPASWHYPEFCAVTHSSKEMFVMGIYSLLLTLINIFVVCVGAWVMFKIKEVAPVAGKTDFWAKHVPEARNFNTALKRNDPENVKLRRGLFDVLRAKQTSENADSPSSPKNAAAEAIGEDSSTARGLGTFQGTYRSRRSLMQNTFDRLLAEEKNSKADVFSADFFEPPTPIVEEP